ncbi:MAG: iron ABC transporter permease [Myxococcales bacterium]|nr:iron ABC transporter permease [Myxococcota bacterium]MDW8280677.1 iron ABC transporter permease [Myxococcales bacterium]
MRVTPHRAALVLSLCALLCLAGIILGPLFGSTRLDLRQVLDTQRPAADNPAVRVLLYVRLPRVLAAAVAGAGLAAAGVAFQGLLRNPLASPYTLGVSSGGSLGAVLAIRLGLEGVVLLGVPLGPVALPLCALLGALATVLIVWWLSERAGAGPVMLLLAGVVVAFIASALITLVLYTADFGQTYRIVRWQMGDLDVMRYDLVLRMAVPVAMGLVLLLPRGRDLNALGAGPEAAAGLGVDVRRATRRIYFAASLTVGAVVSVVGPIGFVGLLVPHALRTLVGPDHRLLLPASMLCGAPFLIACDALGQVIARPAVLPVGVITACLGGPVFLAMLMSRRLRAHFWG